MNLHAHINTASADCDGPMYREYVGRPNDDEIAMHEAAEANGGWNDFSDLAFKARMLENQVSFHSEFGVTVKVNEHGFDMHEQTDEGYRSADVRWCEDEDCEDAYSQRDVFAEMMGY